MSNKEKERKLTLTNLPLNQFKVGQPLMITFMSNGHSIYCEAEFLAIERGFVKVKVVDVQSPTWYSYKYDVIRRYPDYIAKLRASKCFVWGKSGQINWERCHWFKDTKTPAV